jgi:hypothetical protein
MRRMNMCVLALVAPVVLVVLVVLAGCDGIEPEPGCRCAGDVPEGTLSVACGEEQCVGGLAGYRCTGANTAISAPEACMPIEGDAGMPDPCACDTTAGCDDGCACDAACVPDCACDTTAGCDDGCACDDACPAPRWTIEQVSEVGFAPAIALDAAGDPHVVYQGIEEIGWSRRQGAWSHEILEAGGSRWATFALTPAGIPDVIWYDFDGERIYEARWNGSDWDWSSVDSFANSVQFSHAFDASGARHLAYYDADARELLYLRDEVQTVIAAGTNVAPSLRLAAGVPHVVYRAHGIGMRLARLDGDVWMIEDIADEGGPSSLALDASGNPRVCFTVDRYLDDHISEPDELFVATKTAGAWTVETVATDARDESDCAIAALPDGTTAVLYTVEGSRGIALVHGRPGAFDRELIEPACEQGITATATLSERALVAGADGTLHMTFTCGGARYARGTP